MEESKQFPEENSIESSSEIKKESNKEENVKHLLNFMKMQVIKTLKKKKQTLIQKKKNQNLKIILFLKEFSMMDLMEFHQILTTKCWLY